MTGNYPKRLIEVDLPIKRISAHARREKSIRHGHISTLHIWWARRPLAACRAVVCASLWLDPADDICPPQFVETARQLMTYWGHNCLKKCSNESSFRFNKIVRIPECLDDGGELRKALLDFIADFANWNNSTDEEYLAVARTLTVAAHDALEGINGFGLPESISAENLNKAIKDAPRPLLVDPFAGGGAIPLEGLRCGADAFASDLNPVAVLLNKVVLEYIPKYGRRLADEVEKWGKWIKEQAEKELAEFYPKDEDGATPIAYLWARTITCEGPGCGAEVPLIRSLWLAKKGARSIAVQIIPKSEEKRCDFVIIKKENGKWVDQQHPNKIYEKPKFEGTMARGSATCPCCGFTTPVKSVRKQLCMRKGGVDDSRLWAVFLEDKNGKRKYRLANKIDLESIEKCKVKLSRKDTSFLDKELPLMSGVFNVPIYGHDFWGTLFSIRQKMALLKLSDLVKNLKDKETVKMLLSLAVDRQVDYSSSICTWVPNGEFVGHTFAQGQSLPIKLDYAETVALANGSGSWEGAVGWIVRVCRHIENSLDNSGTAMKCSATEHILPENSSNCIITDPPYYNAVPYADLSDFFYIWLKRNLEVDNPDLFGTFLSPKEKELCEMSGWDSRRYSHKDSKFYESGMRQALAESKRICSPDGIGTVVFAHKATDGWESLLGALIGSGWVVTASWPIDTERAGRLRAMGSAALASSVHIVCRPRENKDGKGIESIGDWRDVLSELPGRISAWLPRLASEGVVGADAIFACLGPALEIFSRYSSVEKASGEVVPLREYLEHVWAEVARQALNMIFEDADASGFEEDARLTAMWLWTLRTDANGNGAEDEKAISLPGYTLEYDAARKIAQGLGCHLEHLTYLVEVKGSKAMLLSAESRARYLFGKQEVGMTARRGKKKESAVQLDLFSLTGSSDEEESGGRQAELERPPAGKTVLDQLHQAMLLFTAGRGAALKRFLVDDGIGSNPQFWTLAQALSALYPPHTNEKRWVDGVLARKKGLGF
jgi:adenine-specific DNA methylase